MDIRYSFPAQKPSLLAELAEAVELIYKVVWAMQAEQMAVVLAARLTLVVEKKELTVSMAKVAAVAAVAQLLISTVTTIRRPEAVELEEAAT